jgi:hypothetical protein
VDETRRFGLGASNHGARWPNLGGPWLDPLISDHPDLLMGPRQKFSSLLLLKTCARFPQVSASVQLATAALHGADACDTMEKYRVGIENRRALQLFMRAWTAVGLKASSARSLAGAHAPARSIVLRTALQIRSPNGHRPPGEERCGRKRPHSRGDFIRTSCPSHWPNLLHFEH